MSKFNWKNEATYTAIAGLAITGLAVFGVTTASEGTALGTAVASIVSGVIGLVVTIKAIVARHKAASADTPEG